MNRLTDLYQINGKPLLAPDADVEMEFQDLDGADAGRDESGYMHRSLIRTKVGVWNFSYAHLTRAEYAYMLTVLRGADTFSFTYPDPATDAPVVTRAYLSQYGIAWHDSRTGHYRNLKFSVIEC